MRPASAGTMMILQGVLVRRPSRILVNIGMTGAEVTSVQVVVGGEGTMSL